MYIGLSVGDTGLNVDLVTGPGLRVLTGDCGLGSGVLGLARFRRQGVQKVWKHGSSLGWRYGSRHTLHVVLITSSSLIAFLEPAAILRELLLSQWRIRNSVVEAGEKRQIDSHARSTRGHVGSLPSDRLGARVA